MFFGHLETLRGTLSGTVGGLACTALIMLLKQIQWHKTESLISRDWPC